MTAETRYWVYSGSFTAAGLLLLAVAAIAHLREHRRSS